MDTISIAQAIVAITILRDEAQERVVYYHGYDAGDKAILERDIYQTVLNILSNVKESV